MNGGQVLTLVMIVFMAVIYMSTSGLLIKDYIEAKMHAKNLYYFVDFKNTIPNDVAVRTTDKWVSLENLTIETKNLAFS